MPTTKSFSAMVRQDMTRLALLMKQLEFRLPRQRGRLKRRLRAELAQLKRMKAAIASRLTTRPAAPDSARPMMESVRADLARLQTRVRQLRDEHFPVRQT